MPYHPTTIANYFISRYVKKARLTPGRLNALTYKSHGWYMALNGNKEGLVDESPVPTQWGPLFLSIYSAALAYPKIEITSKLPSLKPKEEITISDQQFLDKIWETYSKYDAAALTGSIILEMKANNYSVIQDDDIYAYYKSCIVRDPEA